MRKRRNISQSVLDVQIRSANATSESQIGTSSGPTAERNIGDAKRQRQADLVGMAAFWRKRVHIRQRTDFVNVAARAVLDTLGTDTCRWSMPLNQPLWRGDDPAQVEFASPIGGWSAYVLRSPSEKERFDSRSELGDGVDGPSG
jgi:hypothetical protein